MCQPSQWVKFCTCAGDEPLDYPRWELWRAERKQKEAGPCAVGEIVPPPLDHQILANRLLQDLNRPDAFDMDLGFRNGDKLVLHWREDDHMVFRFHGGTWLGSWGSGISTQDSPAAVGRIERHWR